MGSEGSNEAWAARGSQLQVQLYVNRHPDELSRGVLAALPALQSTQPEIEWVSPHPPAFSEPRDGTMLSAVGLGHLAGDLAEFWPARGPVWDALAICRYHDGRTGVILAEGKSYPQEMYSGGTHAGESGSKASHESRRKIERATAWTQERVGVEVDVARWLDPLDPNRSSSSLYQMANRIMYAVWLREHGIDAWLCHLLFVNDPTHHPTSPEAWEAAIATASTELGIDGTDIPYVGHALLGGLDPAEEL